MSEYLIQGSTLTAIGDAIREKTGKTNMLSPVEMANEIVNIKSGEELNFSVVGSITEPENPTENMIWVNTDVRIVKWYFSNNQPAFMSEGEVWFYTGSFSFSEFNIFIDNSLLVCPQGAQQYVNGTLVNREALIYQGGEWKSFIIWLINNENTVSFACTNCSVSSVNSNGLNIKIVAYSDGNVAALFWASNMYDLTNINTISASGFSGSAINNSYYPCLAVYPTTPYFNGTNNNSSALIRVSSSGETTLDVSALKGLYYVGFHILAPGSSTVIVPKLKLG